jgi:endonuclease G
MFKTFIVSLALVASSLANAQSQNPPADVKTCAAQIPYGIPTVAKQDTTVICRKAYILQHDNKAKIPEWVSYVLTPDHTTGCVKRSNAFAPDESLSLDQRSNLKDYAKSGYDIGHQANDGDMSWDNQVERESFILSNMAPQLPGFNRGIWKKLEDQTRAWSVNRNHALLVYVGPVYNKQDKTIGKNMVVVPHAFYKIIVDTETSEVMVFEFQHQGAKGSLNQFITSLAQVQKDTGIVFPMPKSAKFADTIWTSASKSARKAKGLVCSIN